MLIPGHLRQLPIVGPLPRTMREERALQLLRIADAGQRDSTDLIDSSGGKTIYYRWACVWRRRQIRQERELARAREQGGAMRVAMLQAAKQSLEEAP